MLFRIAIICLLSAPALWGQGKTRIDMADNWAGGWIDKPLQFTAPNTVVPAGTTDHPVLGFTLTRTGTSTTSDFTAIDLCCGSGPSTTYPLITLPPLAPITAARLYHDANANGVVDAGDTLLAATSGYENYMGVTSALRFGAFSSPQTIHPSVRTYYLVTVDFDHAAAIGSAIECWTYSDIYDAGLYVPFYHTCSPGGVSGPWAIMGQLHTIGAPPLQQDYTVQAGASSYADLSNPTAVVLGDDDITAPIAPAGFAFRYFGITYTEFRIGSNGYLTFGGNTTVAGFPRHYTAPGLVISPYWGDLMPDVAGTIGYEFQGNLLTVEWNNVPERDPTPLGRSRGVRMQVVLHCSSGEIEFRYGDTIYDRPTQIFGQTVAISGPSTTSQLNVIPGYYPGYVTAAGAVVAFPVDRYIRFAPRVARLEVRESLLVLTHDQSSIGTSREFAAQFAGAGAAAWVSIEVHNTGTADLVLGTVAMSGANFVLDTAGFPVVIPPSASGSFAVAFDPLTPGTYVAWAELQHNDVMQPDPFRVEFSGVALPSPAPGIEVFDAGPSGTPVPYGAATTGQRDFGNVEVGSSPAPIELYVRNAGNADLIVSYPSISGPFRVTAGVFPMLLAPGEGATFSVGLDASSTGHKAGVVQLPHNGYPSIFPFEVAAQVYEVGQVPDAIVVTPSRAASGCAAGPAGTTGLVMLLATVALLGRNRHRRHLATQAGKA